MIRWFVTTPGRNVSNTATDASSAIHAKEMGTTQTACGVDASSWSKQWTTPFNPYLPNACARCVERVRQEP